MKPNASGNVLGGDGGERSARNWNRIENWAVRARGNRMNNLFDEVLHLPQVTWLFCATRIR